MALPTTVVSDVGLRGHHPPVKSSGGAFYTVVRADADELDVYKATDPTDSWTVQDSGDGPVHAGTLLGYATTVDDNIIHIIAWISDRHEYYTFDMDTDQWVIDEAVTDTDIQSTPPDQPWASIAVRSDGDIVVVYGGETDASMGDEKERVDVNIRTSGTWSGPTSLDSGGDKHYGNPNCVLGTNDFVHCLWQHTEDTAFDPPTIWNATQGRSIDPADDSLSTVDLSSADTADVLLGQTNAITYDDGGTQRIIISGGRLTLLHTAQGTESSNDILLTAPAVLETLTAEFYENTEVGIATTVALNADIHCLYSGGGTAGVDQDLYYITSTDNGDSWSTETEEIDAITVNFISANIYVRGADTVMAYLYDDGGVQKYNEKVLIAGAAAPFLPFHPKRPNVLLRM